MNEEILKCKWKELKDKPFTFDFYKLSIEIFRAARKQYGENGHLYMK